ncbi:MAG: hypothetical protein DHS20C18_32760 [Saprospiraceae bacterium]|nr:MAG: hypothetical protein DHS20C18_32760 [Saprospiraceae bacterium]
MISKYFTIGLALLWCLLFSALLDAQTVSTFTNTPSNGDVAVDQEGNVYVTSESSGVARISPSGVVDNPFFASGVNFTRASGLCFDNAGTTLYVTNRPLNQLGWITKVNPDGSSQIFATGLNFPGDISFDDMGNMYVTEFNNKVRKITPEGTVSLYAQSPLFNTALGIAWTPGDTLFVSSAHDGNIYKLSPGNPVQIELFAHVNGLQQAWACGFMTYSNGHLYITNGDNKVHSIDRNGVVDDFAGTGAYGGIDGETHEAQFAAPNGIGFNADLSKLFVTEYGLNRVRVIDGLTTTVGIQEKKIMPFNMYPNPFKDEINFTFDLQKPSPVSITIYDSKGTRIKEMTQEFKSSGEQQISWDTGELDMAGGVYFAVIRNGTRIRNLKIIHANQDE